MPGISDLSHLSNPFAEFCYLLPPEVVTISASFSGAVAMNKERIIQEFVPGKQVTLAHLIAHPGAELAKKIGVPEAGAIGIMTLTPGETAMIAGDLAMKAADVHIGFLDRFSGALVIYGSVGAVEEALLQTVTGLGRLLNYTLCELTKS
jgi:ethanolamine utilization protein EutS